eukprot:CAMPEP_0181178438 /NCGR_PEP_ID=MMETSP1096-20121128/5723_1 /TAXON_ID=156174 ORGANISM="Chrysochromulina ericina, Strain CCMP281" /NCGR_SAMPLE_ID=MMETSP1096 /ASSEMBLY_ACC=CAM_ASM_000453 /LENGTH=194 /DNA_ID=CAMNT_0023266713 /DNA_START=116 /DNA_END=701 /DNA_ORIENTATION=-
MSAPRSKSSPKHGWSSSRAVTASRPRVDEGWPTSSGSTSTPRTTMDLSESGNWRDHEAKWGQKDWSTSIERRASCTWSWPLILAARTIYSSRRFFVSAHVLGVDAALGIGRARETLQCPLHGAWSMPPGAVNASVAIVGVMSSDFYDGGMLYYDRVGQGRKNSGVERVFAPGSREKHGRDQSRAHHALLYCTVY